MEKKGDLNNSDQVMIVNIRQAGQSIPETADFRICMVNYVQGLQRIVKNRGKKLVISSSMCEIAMLRIERRNSEISSQQQLQKTLVTFKVCRRASMNAQHVKP